MTATSLDSHYMRSPKAASSLDRLVIAGLIAALGVTDANAALLFEDRMNFAFDTDAGTVRGTLYLCDHIEGRGVRGFYSPGWVHFRFDDTDAAKAMLPHAFDDRLNGYSGKWNFMFSGVAHSQVPAVAHMTRELDALNPRDFRII